MNKKQYMTTAFSVLEDSPIVRRTVLALIILSVILVIIDTFSGIPPVITELSFAAESIITAAFTVEYLVRLWTAPLLYPALSPAKARLRFVVSLSSLIDLIAIVPFYAMLMVPNNLRLLRVIRIFRVFRILKLERYTSALHSVIMVIKSTAGQLVSSLAVFLLLLIVASVFMYLAEYDAQPEVFCNALSGLWWAITTVTTVGYGDIYPVTPIGKLLGAFISLLGVGLIAIPTGIISAGFIKQAQKNKK
ncbi:MAG: ion transporter [Coriobacteriales bacterium]|jgi:voltage-gated potassium channel|nr:ion transporter [Coriobacteriales bacterium]